MTVTKDDVAALEHTLAAIDRAEQDARDLADRWKRKENWQRVSEMRKAISTLGAARRVVEQTMR